MIGLVLVSHSRALANALLDLTRQVASPDVPIAIAAGVGDNRSEFGTDAIEIHDAIQSVYTPDGVLVLMDLGSAILSTEMALELLPEDMHAHIKFCPAPLVEGTIAAAVQAGLGSSLDIVYNEARQALIPKQEQLGIPNTQVPISETNVLGWEIVLTLHTTHGLHARPAAQFVQTAGRYDAQITVRNQTTGKGPVSAKSLNALATLGALYGHEIAIMADGPQANAALDSLTRLVQDNFGETEPAHVEINEISDKKPQPAEKFISLENGAGSESKGLSVVAISEGIALGPLARLVLPPPTIPDHPLDDLDTAWARLEIALFQVEQEIHTRRRSVALQLGEEQAAIFDAHLLILSDPDLLDKVRAHIVGGLNEAQAWDVAIRDIQNTYLMLDDTYLRQRATDVADVAEQVLRKLLGETTEKIIYPEPAILVSEDLTPTQTAQLDLEFVLGLLTIQGGPTSHSAILARSFGMPAVSGVPESMMAIPEGTLVGIDGGRGLIWINPTEDIQVELRTRRDLWLKQRAEWQKASEQPAITADGREIEVVANVGNMADVGSAVKNGAEGIGLLRTEFLFLSRTTAPDEEEQFEALREIFGAMGNRPVIIRTMDVGGDKPLSYIPLPEESNPFLGVRGLRLSLQRPDLFSTQLRAILRAGLGHVARIMFPMVSDLDEILNAQQILADTHAALDKENIPHTWPVETGIMVEVPSAALLSPILAPHVDFFSIGTNDLTQYTLAAERGNPNLSGFADAMHPAVLKLIGQVVEVAETHGKWVGVCGELAGDPIATPVLVGLGVKELSLNPAGIPKIKAVVRKMSFETGREFARSILSAKTASAAREQAEKFLV